MAKPMLGGASLLRDALREQRLFNTRAIAAWLCVVVLLLVLLGQLIYLQVFHHRHYAVLSENNRLRILPLPPPRGFIYDREGRILAANRPAYGLEVVPEQAGDIEVLLVELNELISLTEDDQSRFRRALRQKRQFEGVTLRLHLDEDEIARFLVEQYRFPGVNIIPSLARYYPLGTVGVHVVGYVGRIDQRELETLDMSNYRGTKYIGKVGIEKAYESLLHGKAGLEHVETNAEGRTLRVLESVPAAPGHNLYLNVDIGLQRFAERQLEGQRGAIVALDPRSGAVLAMSSAPAYDPNLFVRRMDQETYRKLNHPF
ncbi:MAG: penicillin-binding protein 2, partial [Pseudomonadota bacterium]